MGTVTLMFTLSTRLFEVQMVILSLGRVYNVLRLQRGFFLYVDKFITIDNLIKKTLSLVGWCCLCWCSGETVSRFVMLFMPCGVKFSLCLEFSR